jgi:hypothetical protein
MLGFPVGDTLPTFIFAPARGAGRPYTLSRSSVAVRMLNSVSRIAATVMGERLGLRSCVNVADAVSSVMSWSTNCPKYVYAAGIGAFLSLSAAASRIDRPRAMRC